MSGGLRSSAYLQKSCRGDAKRKREEVRGAGGGQESDTKTLAWMDGEGGREEEGGIIQQLQQESPYHSSTDRLNASRHVEER